jgi:hypothetical protein
VAAQFEECREKITEMPGIIKDLCRVLYFGKVELIPVTCSLWIQSSRVFFQTASA